MIRKILFASLMVVRVVHAGGLLDVKMYHDNDAVDPQEVARILGGNASSNSAPAPLPQATSEPIRMRSIRMLDPASAPVTMPVQSATLAAQASDANVAATAASVSAVASAANASTAAAPSTSALSLPVQFAFDSVDILPKARPQLSALAAGIRMIKSDRPVTIEGHTDAAGSEQYNLELSRRRAVAVKNYLVTVEGIDESRLKAVGVGEYQPYDQDDPYSPENRRVQFRGS